MAVSKILYQKSFQKAFEKRIAHSDVLRDKFHDSFALFLKNPKSATLKDHALKGNLIGKRAFAVGFDLRVVYAINKGVIILYDIGSHNQVY